MENKNLSSKFNTDDIDFIAPVRLLVKRKTQKEILKSSEKINDEYDDIKSCLKAKTKSSTQSSKSREKLDNQFNKRVTFKKNIQELIIVTSYKKINNINNFTGLAIRTRKDDENEQNSCTCSIF